MNVAFYGLLRGVGTSANLTAVAHGLACLCHIPVRISDEASAFEGNISQPPMQARHTSQVPQMQARHASQVPPMQARHASQVPPTQARHALHAPPTQARHASQMSPMQDGIASSHPSPTQDENALRVPSMQIGSVPHPPLAQDGNCLERLRMCQEFEDGVALLDCGRLCEADLSRARKRCDLLAVNLTVPCRGLAEICYRQSLFRENIIFLIGKYCQQNQQEIEEIAEAYRLDPGRVCAIPYNPHFQEAYERRRVSGYLKRRARAGGSYADAEFYRSLSRTLQSILYFGQRKGEKYGRNF